MSAWGISNFENDTAMDWVDYLIQENKGVNFKDFVNTFIDDFASDQTTLIECSKFLTVAETIAGLVGNPAIDFPEELADWIEKKYIKIEQKTLNKTKEGVKLVMLDSEAKEMYLDSGYFKSWEKAQKDLIKRLSE